MTKEEKDLIIKAMVEFLADEGEKVPVVLDNEGNIEQVYGEFVDYDESEQVSLNKFKEV